MNKFITVCLYKQHLRKIIKVIFSNYGRYAFYAKYILKTTEIKCSKLK